jgi:hypothetical protein
LAIDRFYANSSKLENEKKTILLAAAHDDEDWTMQALVENYQAIIRYMKWEDKGIILATGCGSRSDIEKTDFPAQAYQMGKTL